MLDEVLELFFRPITKRLESLMASAEQLQQQVMETKQSLQDAIARVEEDVQNLQSQTGGIDPADLDPISTGLAELKSNLDALDPDPSNPPTGGDAEGG
jgi:predicted  nucleic acid-binding Zn-ribbon protein